MRGQVKPRGPIRGRGNKLTVGTDSISWDAVRDLLRGFGVREVALEEMVARFRVPSLRGDFAARFEMALRDPWLITYRDKGVLSAVPCELADRYFAELRAELCGEDGVSERAFEMLYVTPAERLHLSSGHRWTIPSLLFRWLETDNGVSRQLVLRPREAWIEICSNERYEQDLRDALGEAERANAG